MTTPDSEFDAEGAYDAEEFARYLDLELGAIRALLITKNSSYGNSALDPLHVFSQLDPLARLNVRIDDKLSRIARGNNLANEDTELDLTGYLILKRVLQRIKGKTK